jgi:hypothetical protein
MGDKKLADLFTPYGTVIYSKVGVEKDTGRNRTYGMNPSSCISSIFSSVTLGFSPDFFAFNFHISVTL